MPFPDAKRVFYQNNPLAEVTCQLRFPAILRIDKDPPADFQERIRLALPILRETPRAHLTTALAPLPVEIA